MPFHFTLRASLTAAFVILALAGSERSLNAQPLPAMSAPMDAASTNPPENPLVSARVRQEFAAWQNGRIDRMTYSPDAGGTYDDALIAVVRPDLTAIGPVQSVTYRTTSLLIGDLVYRYEVNGTLGAISVLYSLDQRGKTDGIVFTPEVFRANP